MGADVYPIGRHNLDTSSLESLAKDLSNRFKANVQYGVEDEFHFDWDGFHREPSLNIWIFGKVDYPNSEKNLTLTDKFFQYNVVIGRYGYDAYKLPYFAENSSNKNELDEAKNNKFYYLCDNSEDELYGLIFNDTFHNWYNYFQNRWRGFHNAFTENENSENNQKEVNSFRYEVMNFFEKIGCREAFYFDDQGESQYLVETLYDWQTILQEVEKNLEGRKVRISDFMEHKKLFPVEVYISAFYDDFADLKNTYPT